MTMPIYVFAGAPTLANMLNSVAIFMTTSGYDALCVMIGLVGVAVLAQKFLSSGNYMQLFTWACVFVVCESFFLLNKTDVEVIDVTDKTSFVPVGNVPLGLAFVASELSTISYGLAKDVAFAFQMPNDQEYTKTGFMFGSKLTNTTLDTHITDTNLMSQWDHYTSQCILPDIALAQVNKDKYTMNELNSAPDIFDFLANNHPSPLRGIEINGQFNTCAEALPKLKASFEAEADKNATLLGKTNYPNRKTLQQDIKNIIGNTYNYLFGMPNDARAVLVQNMAINGIKQGITFDASKNNAQAALNFATTQAQTGQTTSYLTAGELAQTYIPEFQSVLFIFLIAIFPFILLFIFIPEQGIKILQKYMMGLVFVSVLPVTFSILHCIMMSFLEYKTNGYSEIYKGITLSNVDQIAYKNTQLASIAGYLMSLTVYMTYVIVSGLASGLVTMAERMGALANTSVNAPAHAWTSGNLSLANSSVSNTSLDNISGNKHDLNPTNFGNRASYDTQAGDIIHKYSGGGSNIEQNTSHLRDSINVQSSIGASLDQAKAHNLSATKSDQEALSNSVVSRHNDQLAYADRINTDSSFTSGMTKNEQMQFSEAAQMNENITQEVMKRTGYSHDQAVKALNGIDFKASVGTPGKGLFGSSASVDGHHGNDASSSDSNTNSGSNSDLATLQNQYHQNQQIMKSAIADVRLSEMSGDAKSMATHINDDYSNTQDASKRVSADLSEQQSINQAIRDTKSDSAGITRNLNHRVWNDLVGQYGQERADKIVNAKNNTPDGQIYQKVQQGYIDDQVNKIKAKYGISDNTFDGNQIKQQHKIDSSSLTSPVVSNENRDAIGGTYYTNKELLTDYGKDQGIKYDKSNHDQFKASVSHQIDGAKNNIHQVKTSIDERQNIVAKNVSTENQANHEKVNEEILSPNGSSDVSDTVNGVWKAGKSISEKANALQKKLDGK